MLELLIFGCILFLKLLEDYVLWTFVLPFTCFYLSTADPRLYGTRWWGTICLFLIMKNWDMTFCFRPFDEKISYVEQVLISYPICPFCVIYCWEVTHIYMKALVIKVDMKASYEVYVAGCLLWWRICRSRHIFVAPWRWPGEVIGFHFYFLVEFQFRWLLSYRWCGVTSLTNCNMVSL